MVDLYNAELKPLDPGTPTHPWDHATRLFVADNLRLAPKQTFLYYVVINIDTTAYQAYKTGGVSGAVSSILGDGGASSQSLVEQYESGLMAKRVDLPKFTMGTKTLNAYNRKNIVQTHIQYDPVTITFHDDSADVVTNFWNDYYTYYYRDSDYGLDIYQMQHKYQARQRAGWGFSPRNSSLSPFLRNIQIYSLHNKRFTEYTLVNPFISSWRHGEHDSYNSNGTMENQMTVAYETVKYRTGYVNPVDVNGFSVLHYDGTSSPISTSVSNIYTDGGLIGAIAQGAQDLARPDGISSGNGVMSDLLSAYRLYNNLKGANFGTIINTSLTQIGGQVLNSAINTAINNVIVPTQGSVGSSQVYAQTGVATYSSPYATPNFTNGVTVGGAFATATAGSAVNAVTQTSNQWVQGIIGVNQPLNPAYTKMYDVQGINGGIKINPQTGQPVTGSIITTFTDENGKVTSQSSSTGTQSGTFDPANPTVNLLNVQQTTDESGNSILMRTYRDGTRVTETPEGVQLGVYPGSYSPTGTSYNPAGTNPNPANASAQAASGATVGKFYTDPKTGITYTVSGGLTGQITNTITGATGAVTGLAAGQSVNSLLNSNTFLGKSVLGRTVSAGVSTAIGAQVGKIVNNGLQPVVNSLTGTISQGFDSVTGSIKNVVSSWTGTGGYNATKPLDNIVSKTVDANGSNVYTYKDGTIRTVDAEGVQSIVPGKSAVTAPTGILGQNSDASAGTEPGTVLTDSSGQPIGGSVTGEYNTNNTASIPGYSEADISASYNFDDNYGNGDLTGLV